MGRRAYRSDDLDRDAAVYESAAGLAEDPARILDLIPSWLWTPEEQASVMAGEQEGTVSGTASTPATIAQDIYARPGPRARRARRARADVREVLSGAHR